jgi:hypothetical protein
MRQLGRLSCHKAPGLSRPSRVCFAPSSDIQMFCSELAPSVLDYSPRVSGLHSQILRSILKKPLRGNSMPTNYSSDIESCKNQVPSSRTADLRHHNDGCTIQGDMIEPCWQLIRHPRWWRRNRILPGKPSTLLLPVVGGKSFLTSSKDAALIALPKTIGAHIAETPHAAGGVRSQTTSLHLAPGYLHLAPSSLALSTNTTFTLLCLSLPKTRWIIINPLAPLL